MHILSRIRSHFSPSVFVLIAVLVMMTAVSFAQTPVPIEIDTNALFTSANTWISSFIPIFALSIGIAIALAILGFLGNQIVKAFKGGGAK
jgi:hypothetical protein